MNAPTSPNEPPRVDAPDSPDAPPAARPKSGLSYLLLAGLFMLGGLILLAWFGTPPASSAVGEPLPRIDLQPLVYATEPIDRDALAGRYAVLHIWGTWCPPCRLEFPEFAALAEQFQDRSDVAIVSISCSQGAEYDLESLERETIEFMAPHGVDIPTYTDSAALTRGQIAILLPGSSLGYPTTLLVDPEGVIAEVIIGYGPGEMKKLAQKIESLTRK